MDSDSVPSGEEDRLKEMRISFKRFIYDNRRPKRNLYK